MAYEDEVADLARGYTSTVEHPDEDEDLGTSTLASVGSPVLLAQNDGPPDTGRYSSNGNQLPPRLYSRDRAGAASSATDPMNDVPDAQYAAATGTAVDDGAGAPAATSTAAPGGGAPDYAQAGFAGELANLKQGDRTTRMMEAQPTEEDTLRPLQDTMTAASVPVDPRQKGVDVPGQPYQENYRPSVGDRILRGVQAYGRRGVMGAVNPAAAGVKPYGAGNANYDQEVARRAAVVQNTAQRITQAQQAFKERQAQLKQQGESEQAQSLGYSRLPTGVAGQMNAKSDAIRAAADQQRADQENPVNKAATAQALQDAEYKRIDAQNNDPKNTFSKLPAWAKAYRLANNGKLPEGIKGREATEGEISFSRTYKAWQQENPGKKPTVDQLADITAKSKGQTSPSDKADEQHTRDSIRTSTTRLSAAARGLAAAQKAAQGFVPKARQQSVQDALTAAQQEFDAATEKLNGIGQDADAPGGGQAPGGAQPVTPKPVDQSHPPPMTSLQGLRPGAGRKFKNGQVWTVENGRPKRVS